MDFPNAKEAVQAITDRNVRLEKGVQEVTLKFIPTYAKKGTAAIIVVGYSDESEKRDNKLFEDCKARVNALHYQSQVLEDGLEILKENKRKAYVKSDKAFWITEGSLRPEGINREDDRHISFFYYLFSGNKGVTTQKLENYPKVSAIFGKYNINDLRKIVDEDGNGSDNPNFTKLCEDLNALELVCYTLVRSNTKSVDRNGEIKTYVNDFFYEQFGLEEDLNNFITNLKDRDMFEQFMNVVETLPGQENVVVAEPLTSNTETVTESLDNSEEILDDDIPF